jgi:hypothetical protein
MADDPELRDSQARRILHLLDSVKSLAIKEGAPVSLLAELSMHWAVREAADVYSTDELVSRLVKTVASAVNEDEPILPAHY